MRKKEWERIISGGRTGVLQQEEYWQYFESTRVYIYQVLATAAVYTYIMRVCGVFPRSVLWELSEYY